LPLCLTFIDVDKAFNSVETEAVLEALLTQGVPTQYIRVLRELYSGFTTKISSFYNAVVIDVRKGATLENVMLELEWEDVEVKVDGQQLHHLRFADDIM
uniref:Reverse transcriptase domain-containing protein n=1 Tax=Heligmosomoides polygyrus TaxID=6339 RepID=A0A183GA40_HELPZ